MIFEDIHVTVTLCSPLTSHLAMLQSNVPLKTLIWRCAVSLFRHIVQPQLSLSHRPGLLRISNVSSLDGLQVSRTFWSNVSPPRLEVLARHLLVVLKHFLLCYCRTLEAAALMCQRVHGSCIIDIIAYVWNWTASWDCP